MRLALLLLLAAMAGVVIAAWWVRPLSVARGLGRLGPEERDRLLAVLDAAAIPPGAVRLVETTGEPCTRMRSHMLARRFHLDRSTRSHCIGIREGRVVSLSLLGAALRELTLLGELASLRHVRLREGDLESVGRLPRACRWESLDIGRNRLSDLTGLEVCTRLTDLDVSQNRLQDLPIAALTDLEALDASENPVQDLASLSGLGRLTELSLRGHPLTDASSIPPLPAMERLELARTRIGSIDGGTVARWPRLRWLGLAATPLQQIASPFEVGGPPSSPQVRLAGGLQVGIRETPMAERLRREAEAAHDGRARHVVGRLPRGSGRWQGSRRSGRTRTGIGSTVEVSGAAEWMTGAHSIAFDVDRGLSVWVTASVQSGRLRIYLAQGDGYVYAEAIPGHPLTIQGRLIPGTERYVVFAEAVGDRAEGIQWSVRRASG